MELCLPRDDRSGESLRVRSRVQTGVGDNVMGVSYRLPHQEEAVHEACFRQLEEASHLQDLVLGGTLTTLISTGRAIQQCKSNPEGFWSALMITS